MSPRRGAVEDVRRRRSARPGRSGSPGRSGVGGAQVGGPGPWWDVGMARGATTVDETRLGGLLRVGEGFELAAVDPGGKPGFDGGKAEGAAAQASGSGRLADLQERLYA